jgi:MoxR-like ATPase
MEKGFDPVTVEMGKGAALAVGDVKALADDIRREVARAIVGQDEAVELMLIALFSSGHILLEGPPGTAKTFLTQCFARVLGLDFGRIQFTPDLMPGDILGSNLFNFQTSQFTLTRGPIFCQLLLADEINRTPPKTQAALLEAMQERAVTIDGTTHQLPPHFMVIATQNPIEQQGVYPLPEAQLDRFLFKHKMDYPSHEEELRIVASHGARFGAPKPEEWGIAPRVDAALLEAAIGTVAALPMVGEVVDYVVGLIRATRTAPDLEGGASPRAAALLAGAARARAALDGRDYVIPDDVKALAPAVLRHRVILSPAAEIEGRPVEGVVARLIEEVEAPR